MANAVEKLTKELGALESRRHELETKRSLNRQRKVELDAKRGDLVLTMDDSDDSEQRKLRSIDAERRSAIDNDEDYAAGLTTLTASIETKKAELRRAERADAIALLESEVNTLTKLDAKVTSALRDLRSATVPLFRACDALAAELRKLDEDRWGGGFANSLHVAIRNGILRAFVAIDQPEGAAVQTFIDTVQPRLRSALAQLAYQNLEGEIPVGKNEKMYRTVGAVTGLRNLDLPHGSLIALDPSEAEELVRNGALVAETQPAA